MTGEEVARQIIVVLSTELGIPSHYVTAAMCDRVSVNQVAIRTVKVLYNQVMHGYWLLFPHNRSSWLMYLC